MRNANLHGNVPDKSKVALLLIDVINSLEFAEGPQLLTHALPMAKRLAELKKSARSAGIPSIYVNDNFGRWRSNFKEHVNYGLREGVPGRPIASLLAPADDDYFVLKPKHSGFYSTTLQLLLTYLGVEVVIITGLSTNICVLFTANDAYVRDYSIIVPRDCCAANTHDEHHGALLLMQKVLKADTRSSTEIELRRIVEQGHAA